MKDSTSIQRMIEEECDKIKAFLLEKNKSYGSSSLDPIGIFADKHPLQNINSRIDDKISRIVRGDKFGDEDFVKAEEDITGYLIIKRVARRLGWFEVRENGKRKYGKTRV